MNERVKKVLPYVVGTLILTLTALFISNELHRPGTLERWQTLEHQFESPGQLKILLWTFALMVANWGTEAVKWRFLLRRIEHLALYRLISSILAGLSLALFTPARIGEYGGRVIYLASENRVKGTLAMLIGGLSQMLVTILCSLTGLSWFVPRYFEHFPLNINLFNGLLILAALVLLTGYFSLHSLERVINSLPYVKRYSHHFSVTGTFSSAELGIVFGLSLLRYLLFSSQYYILLNSFLGPTPFIPVMAALSIVFVIQTMVPAFALADLGIRGAAATFFMGHVLGAQAIPAILATTFGVWLINLILPAVCGLPFIVKLPSAVDPSV